MTEVLLDLAALAVRSEVPVEQLRRYAEARLLPRAMVRLAEDADLRLEIRTPGDATGMLTAVAGLPDAAQSSKPDQP